MNILITGEKGDLGSLFFKILKKKHQIFLINDIHKLRRIDLFIHLGASGPKKDFNKIINSNIIKLNYLLKKLKKIKINETVFFSSTSVYGDYKKTIIKEQDIGNNQSIYGVSKLYGENFLCNNLKSTITSIRIPAVLTSNNFNHYIGKLIKKLKNNKTIIINSNNSKFNFFVDPENLLNFVLNKRKIKKNYSVNICSNPELTLIEILKYLKLKIKSNSKIIIKKKVVMGPVLSNKMSKKIYGFKPYSAKKTLNNWIKRLNYA